MPDQARADVNGAVSFWWADAGGLPRPRAPLSSTGVDVDVAIIGAGFTGLWTAYYLARSAPGLRIALLDREFAGFGASGRNGGWLTGEFGWSPERYARHTSRDAVIAFRRALARTVDIVIEEAAEAGIDADIVKAGALRIATNPAQVERLRVTIEHERDWGADLQESLWLNDNQLARRLHATGALAGDWTPQAARVQPAKLVRGLADAVERLGVHIYERTAVTAIRPHLVATDRGPVRAQTIVRATEGFTAGLPGARRDWLPMNSAMIVTAPLTDRQWEAIGWSGCELLGDTAHAYLYAQRTREGRIAVGGRGIPYRFGSATDVRGATQQATIAMLNAMLLRLFPALRGIRIDHAWCGVLAVPRDWCATVGLDRRTGIGWAGGYVGVGVAASNLAGRTLRSLILGWDDEETGLPWVNRTVRRWEPEPLRWLGVQGLYALYRAADTREHQRDSDRTSRLAILADALAGRG